MSIDSDNKPTSEEMADAYNRYADKIIKMAHEFNTFMKLLVEILNSA